MARRLRVLLLTQWFEPEPAFKGLVFAKELIKQGFDVEVLTGFPNYPGGRVYPGYRIKPLQREVMGGVNVTRVALYPNHDQSAIKRILNYVSFALSALLYGLFMAQRADVIYAYHPPLTVGITAALLRLFRRIPVVYDIQDMWPDTLKSTGMLNNDRLLHIVSAVCRWVYKRMDHIVVLSPGFKCLLVGRGVPADKLSVIYNWADEVALAQPAGTVPPSLTVPGPFRVLFAGNMGKAQSLVTVLDAAQLLSQQSSRVQFVMLGGGVEAANLAKLARERLLDNVVFYPPVPMSEVGAYLSNADALLVHLCKDPLFEITIPSKTQAYMAVGKPLLMAVNGDAAALITQSGGGIVAESENAQSLAQAAQILADLSPVELSNMGRRAQYFYQSELALEIGAQRFAVLFRQLAEAS